MLNPLSYRGAKKIIAERPRGKTKAGGDSGTRTRNLCHAKAALSQLSYIPTCFDYRYAFESPSRKLRLAPWLRQEPRQRLDQHSALLEVDLAHHLVRGREEELAAVAADDVDVVGAGAQHVRHAAQLFAVRADDGEADELEAVVVALRQRLQLRLLDGQEPASQLRRSLAVVDPGEPQVDHPLLPAGAGDSAALAGDGDAPSGSEQLAGVCQRGDFDGAAHAPGGAHVAYGDVSGRDLFHRVPRGR